MAGKVGGPTDLSVSYEKKDSHTICCTCNCCSPGATNNIVNVKQGQFTCEEGEDGVCARIGNCFKRFLCCCFFSPEPDEEKKEENRATRREVETRIVNSLHIHLPGAYVEPAQLERERDEILTRHDSDWKRKKAAGAPIYDDEMRELDSLRSEHTARKVKIVAKTLRSSQFAAAAAAREVTAVPVLLETLVPFIYERLGETHRAGDRQNAVRQELARNGYHISHLYIAMLIDRIKLLYPETTLAASTVALFESIFQVAVADAAQTRV